MKTARSPQELVAHVKKLLEGITKGYWVAWSDEGPLWAPNGTDLKKCTCKGGWTYSICSVEKADDPYFCDDNKHVCVATIIGKKEDDPVLHANVNLIAQAPKLLRELVLILEQGLPSLSDLKGLAAREALVVQKVK